MATKLSPTDLESSHLGYANEEEFKVLAIDALVDTNWRSPIINYLRDPSLNIDRKTKYRALSYVLVGNELFKKTPEGILLKCLGENEAYLALASVHSRACGAHQEDHKMKWLLFKYGMYWPTMLKDCIEFAKGCQECQIHAGIQHAPASELHTPFSGLLRRVECQFKFLQLSPGYRVCGFRPDDSLQFVSFVEVKISPASRI
ncbi:uncharacterized protein LOC131597009 [Vicia villosa]|uniref:uncharacterized protein LOC131597009 n=1 Tax=Vicia villosa TaxID=3911 RepID=UPI00273B8B59|nr:uncharacterized protein LOC131597009 [Vicia villosa]